jgi:uncharacterized protein (DUF1800 family)
MNEANIEIENVLPAKHLLTAVAVSTLSACGGGGGGGDSDPILLGNGSAASYSQGLTLIKDATSAQQSAEPAKQPGLSEVDAARFLTQATFGIRSIQEVRDLQAQGLEHWLWAQFNAPFALHTSYLDVQRRRNDKQRASEEMSYEAVWRQWLFEEGQLRARVVFALSEILVISNVAPDIRPYAMSSYMDMLGQHAFGNYRDLLKAVTLHPAMGYYLNMLESEKENPDTGTHPNENYAREVLQLFSIGLVQLNSDGSTINGPDGLPLPSYSEDVVKGFARAFSGWSFGGQAPKAGQALDELFDGSDYELDANWTAAMRAYPERHETGTKLLLNGQTLPAGQSPEKDMDDALDNIFKHPNVGPFIGRQLIQRLVTSNPSAAYIDRVARVFNDNGQGVRGDLKAVIKAVLLDSQARDETVSARSGYGKLREPVIRLSALLRAFGATTPSTSGRTDLHYLDSPEDGLGQSPLLSPSVFNFFSPNYRHPGVLAQAGLVAPEFQITTETSVVGSCNTLADVVWQGGYGWGEQSRLRFNWAPWEALVQTSSELLQALNIVFCCARMSASTRLRLQALLSSAAAQDASPKERVQALMVVLLVSPDFVVQK